APRGMAKSIGKSLTENLIVQHFQWTGANSFKFSVLNQLNRPVKDVQMIVAFYDGKGQAMDSMPVVLSQGPPIGLAIWTEEQRVDASTAKICRDYTGEPEPTRIR